MLKHIQPKVRSVSHGGSTLEILTVIKLTTIGLIADRWGR